MHKSHIVRTYSIHMYVRKVDHACSCTKEKLKVALRNGEHTGLFICFVEIEFEFDVDELVRQRL